MMMFMFGELNLNYYKMIIMNVEYCVKEDEINNIKPIIDLININSDMTNVFFVESLGNNSYYCLCSLDVGDEYYGDEYWNNEISWELERLSDIVMDNINNVDCFASEEICNALYIELEGDCNG